MNEHIMLINQPREKFPIHFRLHLRLNRGAGGMTIDLRLKSAPEKFQACKAAWIGAKVGIYSLRADDKGAAGHADFDYFRFSSGK